VRPYRPIAIILRFALWGVGRRSNKPALHAI
jgi:hypothetical protein